MTEPAAGSDLQGMKTNAVKDGDDYILNGSKVCTHNYPFIITLISLIPLIDNPGCDSFFKNITP